MSTRKPENQVESDGDISSADEEFDLEILNNDKVVLKLKEILNNTLIPSPKSSSSGVLAKKKRGRPSKKSAEDPQTPKNVPQNILEKLVGKISSYEKGSRLIKK